VRAGVVIAGTSTSAFARTSGGFLVALTAGLSPSSIAASAAPPGVHEIGEVFPFGRARIASDG
jgi:hypothetical protein